MLLVWRVFGRGRGGGRMMRGDSALEENTVYSAEVFFSCVLTCMQLQEMQQLG